MSTKKNGRPVNSLDARKKLYVDLDGTLALFDLEIDKDDPLLRTKEYYVNRPSEREFVRYLKKDEISYEILSAYMSEEARAGKMLWCRRCLGLSTRKQNYVPYGISKADFICEKYGLERLTKDFVLIDDHSPNLIDWENKGGCAIKFLNGINGSGRKWKGAAILPSGEFVKAPSYKIVSDSLTTDELFPIVEELVSSIFLDYRDALSSVAKAPSVLAELRKEGDLRKIEDLKEKVRRAPEIMLACRKDLVAATSYFGYDSDFITVELEKNLARIEASVTKTLDEDREKALNAFDDWISQITSVGRNGQYRFAVQ